MDRRRVNQAQRNPVPAHPSRPEHPSRPPSGADRRRPPLPWLQNPRVSRTLGSREAFLGGERRRVWGPRAAWSLRARRPLKPLQLLIENPAGRGEAGREARGDITSLPLSALPLLPRNPPTCGSEHQPPTPSVYLDRFFCSPHTHACPGQGSLRSHPPAEAPPGRGLALGMTGCLARPARRCLEQGRRDPVLQSPA